jgi:hypothetical protein
MSDLVLARRTSWARTPPDGRLIAMPTLQGCPTALLAKASSAWPLLVLDAGEFLACCRGCGWRSPGTATPGEAWAAFDGHVCEGRPS